MHIWLGLVTVAKHVEARRVVTKPPNEVVDHSVRSQRADDVGKSDHKDCEIGLRRRQRLQDVLTGELGLAVPADRRWGGGALLAKWRFGDAEYRGTGGKHHSVDVRTGDRMTDGKRGHEGVAEIQTGICHTSADVTVRCQVVEVVHVQFLEYVSEPFAVLGVSLDESALEVPGAIGMAINDRDLAPLRLKPAGQVSTHKSGAANDEISHAASLGAEFLGPMRHNRGVPYPVSVQICTLNEEANIGACLEAVLANEPEEIIVIDGGSHDRTVDIAASFGAKVLTPGRLGLGPSRQLGYMSTNCTYSAFIDADDRIGSSWLEEMVNELEAGGYAALQSSLRAVQTGSWWTSGWNEYFTESVRPTADTIMVGRPALFLTEALQHESAELTSLDEDTHLSRRFDQRGLRQGIGHAVAYRYVEESWGENVRKWQSYGRGYKGFIAEHPERRAAILTHMLWTIPIARTARPVIRGKFRQPLFAATMAAAISYGYFHGSR